MLRSGPASHRSLTIAHESSPLVAPAYMTVDHTGQAHQKEYSARTWSIITYTIYLIYLDASREVCTCSQLPPLRYGRAVVVLHQHQTAKRHLVALTPQDCPSTAYVTPTHSVPGYPLVFCLWRSSRCCLSITTPSSHVDGFRSLDSWIQSPSPKPA
jgi:hypothetical protein